MASQYNGQPRPAEVLVCGGKADVIRSREDASSLLAGQRILPRLMF
jgi:diaminopimelate decarboxylase